MKYEFPEQLIASLKTAVRKRLTLDGDAVGTNGTPLASDAVQSVTLSIVREPTTMEKVAKSGSIVVMDETEVATVVFKDLKKGDTGPNFIHEVDLSVKDGSGKRQPPKTGVRYTLTYKITVKTSPKSPKSEAQGKSGKTFTVIVPLRVI